MRSFASAAASRLEALTKQFADRVKDEFNLERVGEFPVRGFTTR